MNKTHVSQIFDQVQKNRKRVCEPIRQVIEIIEDANAQWYDVDTENYEEWSAFIYFSKIIDWTELTITYDTNTGNFYGYLGDLLFTHFDTIYKDSPRMKEIYTLFYGLGDFPTLGRQLGTIRNILHLIWKEDKEISKILNYIADKPNDIKELLALQLMKRSLNNEGLDLFSQEHFLQMVTTQHKKINDIIIASGV